MFRTATPMIALSAAFAFGLAQADDIRPLTREQVRQEYLKAREAGSLPPGGLVGAFPKVNARPSTVSRAEVVRALRKDGPLPTGEGSARKIAASEASAYGHDLTRAEVRAEYEHAKEDGTLPTTGLVGPVRTSPAHSLKDHEQGNAH